MKIITIILSISFIYTQGSYEILILPKDARSLSLNNTISAYDDMSLNNNPATLSSQLLGMSYSYISFPANINFSSFNYSINKFNGILSTRVSLLSYGNIIDSETESISKASDFLFETGYKYKIKKIISVGFSGGYLVSSIDNYKAELVFSKFGICSRAVRNKIGIGLSLENFGLTIRTYSDYIEPLPIIFRLSMYYKLQYLPIIINTDISNNIISKLKILSNSYNIKINKYVSYYLGSKINIDKDNKIDEIITSYLSSISTGIGLQYNNLILDIGYYNFQNINQAIAISITKQFK